MHQRLEEFLRICKESGLGNYEANVFCDWNEAKDIDRCPSCDGDGDEWECSVCTASQMVDELIDSLSMKGYGYVGNGSFSIVFDHPDYPDVVFKYNNSGRDGTFPYLCSSMVIQHERLARVHAVTGLPYEFAAVVERLHKQDSYFQSDDLEMELGPDKWMHLTSLIRQMGGNVEDVRCDNVMLRVEDDLDSWVLSDPTYIQEDY